MVNYPYKKKTTNNSVSSPANRGMNFEHAVNCSLKHYEEQNIALMIKRSTPIHIVKVDYKNNARITDAYFEKESTTDYNGVYQGKYIDFECKETKSKTSLSFNNISKHQILHLEKVLMHGGLAFFLIHFVYFDEVYLLKAEHIISIYQAKTKKSISYKEVKDLGVLVEQGFIPRLKLIDAIDKAYFDEKEKIKI